MEQVKIVVSGTGIPEQTFVLPDWRQYATEDDQRFDLIPQAIAYLMSFVPQYRFDDPPGAQS